jgi:hypothetical protein
VLRLVPGLIPKPVKLPRVPFEGHSKPGLEYKTLLIEPPIFLARLEADLQARSVSFVKKKFTGKSDVFASVPQNTIVNCTGIGAYMFPRADHVVIGETFESGEIQQGRLPRTLSVTSHRAGQAAFGNPHPPPRPRADRQSSHSGNLGLRSINAPQQVRFVRRRTETMRRASGN